MDRYPQLHDSLFQRVPLQQATIPTLLAYAIAALFCLHQGLVYFDVAIFSPVEVLWNTLVCLTPTGLLLDVEKRKELNGPHTTWSQTHAAKSEAMRGVLGLGGRALLQQLPTGGNLVRNMSVASRKIESDAPPGLGNWDNSCYQNSVLQGLSAIDSLRSYLMAFSSDPSLPSNSTSGALVETVAKLHDASNNGRHIWTPAKLKSMSSWQQQDAQEYYSKIIDDLEKEATIVFGATRPKPGLECVSEERSGTHVTASEAGLCNPLEGLLAQRVACTRCGFSEGLSMIPFNCLTVPLGSNYEYDLATCLDEYTNLEDINEVECAKCTLIKARSEIRRMLPQQSQETSREGNKVLQLPPELREKIVERLRAIEKALGNDDFSDKTLNDSCQISKKARVSSTKTRQAVVGRAPQSLVIHVNRSLFDETTGDQRKNYAAVRYPEVLDLGRWMLGSQQRSKPSNAIGEASSSMLSERTTKEQCLYRLKSIVTHYGRHENGHYTAYRQHPPAALANSLESDSQNANGLQESDANQKLPWWRLSDEDASSVSGQDVLRQGGVFMLFYERESVSAGLPDPGVVAAAAPDLNPSTATIPKSADVKSNSQANEVTNTATNDPKSAGTAKSQVSSPICSSRDEPSTGTTTEDESEADIEEQPAMAIRPVPKPTAHPRMRTARVSSLTNENGFGSPGRVVAAT